MSADVASIADRFSPFAQLRLGRAIVRAESNALLQLAQRLDDTFCRAVQLVHDCQGNVIVIGMGKAGWIGQKIAATLASTGTRSHFVHPAEAVHGDLGRVNSGDVVLMLSNSGETEEIVRLLPLMRKTDCPLVAITARTNSRLGRAASVTLEIGKLDEACPLGLAPSTSTTAMLALGDAMALVVSHVRGFQKEDFARFHPGGSLGLSLSRVHEVMRPLDRCRVAKQSDSVRTVLVRVSQPGRRTGAIMLTDARGQLTGLFTDSDLARLFESKRDDALDGPIKNVMTSNPTTIDVDAMLTSAVEKLATNHISELPVIDLQNHPRGLVDITDILGMLPKEDHAKTLKAAQDSESDAGWSMTVPFPDPTSE